MAISQSDTRWVKKKGQAGYVERISTGKRVTGKVNMVEGTKTNQSGTTATYKKGRNADWGKPDAAGGGVKPGKPAAKKPTPSGTGRVSPRAGKNSSGTSNFNGSQTAKPATTPATTKTGGVGIPGPMGKQPSAAKQKSQAKRQTAANQVARNSGQVPSAAYGSKAPSASRLMGKRGSFDMTPSKKPFVGGTGGGDFSKKTPKKSIAGASGKGKAGTYSKASVRGAVETVRGAEQRVARGAGRVEANVAKKVSGVERQAATVARKAKRRVSRGARRVISGE
jgi:hypothetical protein